VYLKALAEAMPEPRMSPVTAVPEALAAVTAFLLTPGRDAGNYATVDVGGSTTDISFFWHQSVAFDPELRGKASYYAWRSKQIGTAKADDRQQFLHGVQAAYRETFRDAFCVRPICRDWCSGDTARWTLLLLGGGTAADGVEEHLRKHPPDQCQIANHDEVKVLTVPVNTKILLSDGRTAEPHMPSGWGPTGNPLRTLGRLLTVAFGLAHRPPDIPRYGTEAPVPPPPLPPPWEPPPNTGHH
jgi:hypothetical protein